MIDNFCCLKCNRSFLNEKGLKTHERNHEKNNGNVKLSDEYIQKRIANTRSVQIHRQLNPKLKFEDLEADTNKAIEEAKKFEKFLKEELGLYITTYEEKLKDYNESNKMETTD